jgi:hypothetical protein
MINELDGCTSASGRMAPNTGGSQKYFLTGRMLGTTVIEHL